LTLLKRLQIPPKDSSEGTTVSIIANQYYFGRLYLVHRTRQLFTGDIEYAEFESWLEAISKDLNDGTVNGDDTLMRFAKPHKYDPAEEPRHLAEALGFAA